MSSVYDLHPLNTGGSTNMRLIKLHSDIPRNPLGKKLLSCQLHVVSLREAPPVSALSYVWGSPDNTETIYLEGVIFAVRKNLWDFHAECRTTTVQYHYLWIDPLCINQDSIEERNHQVAMMGRIYRSASLIIAWIGADYETDLVDILADFHDAAAELDTLDSRDFRGESRTAEVARLSLKDRLGRISRSEYWTRLWIIQEFTVGYRLSIWSGKAMFNTNDVLERLRFQSSEQAQLHLFYWNFSGPANVVVHGRGQFHAGRDLNWFSSTNLIGKFKSSKCCDARDRVYGLLGIIDEDELRAFPVEVDYSESTGALFFRLCKRRQHQLDISSKHDNTEDLQNFADDLREALELPPDYGLAEGVPSWSAYLKALEEDMS